MRRYERLEDSFVQVAKWGDVGVFVDPETGAFIAQLGDDPDVDGNCVSSGTMNGLRERIQAAQKTADKKREEKREPIPIWGFGHPDRRSWRGSSEEVLFMAHITNLRQDNGKALVKIGSSRPEIEPYGSWYRDMTQAERDQFVRLRKAWKDAQEEFESWAGEMRINLAAHAKRVWGITT